MFKFVKCSLHELDWKLFSKTVVSKEYCFLISIMSRAELNKATSGGIEESRQQNSSVSPRSTDAKYMTLSVEEGIYVFQTYCELWMVHTSLIYYQYSYLVASNIVINVSRLVTSKTILPGTNSGSIRKLPQDMVTNIPLGT